ncbi:MAG: type I glyceraldehyde-3-phosphate dehydrogenase [Terriglobia bacterium]
MAVKVAINGFGRIGRNILRAALPDPEIEVVATNDLTDSRTLAHLLKYDSVLGTLKNDVSHTDEYIRVSGRGIRVFKEMDPAKIDWSSLGVQIVVESTGKFTKGGEARKHLRGSVKKVIVTAPAEGDDVTLVLGVNEEMYDPVKHHVISNASCTTNCLAPLAKVIHENFRIVRGAMTTIHSYTNDQRILDFPHKDLRRARAAQISIIPTSTGAAKSLGLVLPELKGKLDGYSMRVPTPDVSLVDLVVFVEKPTTTEKLQEALRKAAEGPLKGILGYEMEELVSVDFRGDSRSCIVDAGFTKVIDGTCVKATAWYDNEWGYSCRVRDLVKYVAGKMQ